SRPCAGTGASSGPRPSPPTAPGRRGGSTGRPRASRPGSRANDASPSRGHSAHVGQEVVVHYRWHPLHGRRVRRQYGEDRLTGRFVHVEAAPGVVTVLAAWMLDPVACAGMELGPPRASLAALADLHRLLIERGSR